MTVKIIGAGALNQESYDVFAAALRKKAAELGVAVELSMATPYPGEDGPTDARPLRGLATKDDAKRAALVSAVAGDLKGLGEADIRVLPCASMMAFEQGITSQPGLSGKHVSLKDALEGAFTLGPPEDKIGVICMPPAKASGVFGKILGEERVVYAAGPSSDQLEEIGARLQKAEIFAQQPDGTPFVGKPEREAAIKRGREEVIAHLPKVIDDMKDKGITRILIARADAPQAVAALKHAGKIPDGVEVKSYLDTFGEYVAQKALECERTRGAKGGAKREGL